MSQRLTSAAARVAIAAPVRPVPHRVLIVDGDPAARDAMSVALLEAGFEVRMAPSGVAALRALQEVEPDLIILDAVLPDRSGIDVLREIRAGDDVPVIMLGARDEEAERILGLELGADDYLTKPVSHSELASRGRAILRRRPREQPGVPSTLTVGSLRVDLTRHEVTDGERSIPVTASEFRFLALLAGSPGTVFTRRQIMEHLWAGPYFGDGHPVDTHVLNLRRKLEADPSRPKRLLTVRGVGFKLVVPGPEETLIRP